MLIRMFIMCAVVAGFAVGLSAIVERADGTRPDRQTMMNCNQLDGSECGGLLRVR